MLAVGFTELSGIVFVPVSAAIAAIPHQSQQPEQRGRAEVVYVALYLLSNSTVRGTRDQQRRMSALGYAAAVSISDMKCGLANLS